MLSNSFANHLAPKVRYLVGLNFKDYAAFYSKFFNVESTDYRYEDALHAAGIPPAVARNEGDPTPFFDPFEGTTMRLALQQFAIGVQVSKELWDDERYKAEGAIRKASNALSKSMTQRVELVAADVFNNGFSAAGTAGSYPTIDGVGLFNTQHKKLIGPNAQYETTGSIGNRPATDVDFSYTALRAAMLQIKQWTDDRGYKIMATPTRLIHPDSMDYDLKEFFSSGMAPWTANNLTVNVHQNELQLESWPFLTDDDAWFIQCAEHELKFVWRERPTFDSYDDKNTRSAKFAAFMRFGILPLHYIGVWGTAGHA